LDKIDGGGKKARSDGNARYLQQVIVDTFILASEPTSNAPQGTPDDQEVF
jgi:hypothetical protein